MSMFHNVPQSFVCAITQEIMSDPVTDREGHTYERAAIMRWLNAHSTSPVTRAPLSTADLVPNRALRDAIEEWRRDNPEARAPVATHVEREQPIDPRALAAVANVPPPTPPAMLTVEVATTAALSAVTNASLLLTLTPPERHEGADPADKAARLPCDLVCVIDTSGSMGSMAIAKDEQGHSEDTGLCVLDVVKHAVLTIAEMLGPNDRLALVQFSNTATSTGWIAMDGTGRDRVKSELAAYDACGGTNMWAGMQAGMDLARTSARNASVFVLTDGLPTVTPPRGYVETLRRYMQDLAGPSPFNLCTFGFGYDMDSLLLSNIADAARGTFSFIPDSGLVGTVFVNAAANLLATWATTVRVKIQFPVGVSPVDTSGVEFDPDRRVAHVDLGTAQFGQPRHLVLDLSVDGGANVGDIAVAAYLRSDGQQLPELRSEPAHVLPSPSASFQDQRARANFARVVPLLEPTPGQKEALAALVAELTSSLAAAAPPQSPLSLTKALVEDLTGEVTLALAATGDAYKRWGKHYFRSIAAANRREQCNNFKDKSVQLYTGAVFAALQSAGERAFLALPPPEPTTNATQALPRRSSYATGQLGCAVPTGAAAAAAPTARAAPTRATRSTPRNMTWAYNAHGGCIAPECLVAMADGSDKRAADIRRGDLLAHGVAVDCVVRVVVPGGSMGFVALPGGLLVSEYHPIRDAATGVWEFPVSAARRLAAPVPVATRFMYSYVLSWAKASAASEPHADSKKVATITVGGFEVAPIAHECPAGVPVIGHAFFGSGASLKALQASPSFAAHGVVDVEGFERDPDTNLIVGLRLR